MAMTQTEARERMAYYQTLSRELSPLVKEFERRVYLDGGLVAAIDACAVRGMSGILGDITMRTFTMAGRVMVTIEQGDSSVSVLAAQGENPPRMGLHSIEGSILAAGELLGRVCDMWHSAGIMQPDTEVRIL